MKFALFTLLALLLAVLTSWLRTMDAQDIPTSPSPRPVRHDGDSNRQPRGEVLTYSLASRTEVLDSRREQSTSRSRTYREIVTIQGVTSENADSEADDDRDDESVDLNCTHCSAIRQAKKSYRINAIQSDILRKLRLSAAPDMRGKVLPSIPHVQRLIDQLNNENNVAARNGGARNRATGGENSEEVDDFHATTLRIILLAQPAPRDVAVNDSTVCYFPLTPDVRRLEIINATFGVYIRSSAVTGEPVSSTTPRPQEQFLTWVVLYRLGRSTEREQRVRIRQKRIRVGGNSEGAWYQFDVKATLVWLISRQETSYGIQVVAADSVGRSNAIVIPRSADEEQFKPYLEIRVKEGNASSRAKRTADQLCEEDGTTKACCRYPLQVNFQEFGWDFVIVPRSYPAYYCSGECPYQYMQTYPHSHLLHHTRPDGGGPCCTPRKVSPMSMIYYDQRMNIVYSKIPDMVVDSCGCS